MARKSGRELDYLFKSYDNAFSLFYNQIMLKPPDEETVGCFELNEAQLYHQKMIDDETIYIQNLIKDLKIGIVKSEIENLFKTPCSLINFKNDCPEYEEISLP